MSERAYIYVLIATGGSYDFESFKEERLMACLSKERLEYLAGKLSAAYKALYARWKPCETHWEIEVHAWPEWSAVSSLGDDHLSWFYLEEDRSYSVEAVPQLL